MFSDFTENFMAFENFLFCSTVSEFMRRTSKLKIHEHGQAVALFYLIGVNLKHDWICVFVIL